MLGGEVSPWHGWTSGQRQLKLASGSDQATTTHAADPKVGTPGRRRRVTSTSSYADRPFARRTWSDPIRPRATLRCGLQLLRSRGMHACIPAHAKGTPPWPGPAACQGRRLPVDGKLGTTPSTWSTCPSGASSSCWLAGQRPPRRDSFHDG